jgi:hypothetical protein
MKRHFNPRFGFVGAEQLGIGGKEAALAAIDQLISNDGLDEFGAMSLPFIGRMRTRVARGDLKRSKKSWTQPELDAAIEEYKAHRSSTYHRLLNEHARGARGAKEAAQSLFGRDTIVKALNVRCPSMVTKSHVYRSIADAFGFIRGKRPRKVGEQVGFDAEGYKRGDTTAAIVERRDIVNRIRQNIGKGIDRDQAEALIEALGAGSMTDDQAIQALEVIRG